MQCSIFHRACTKSSTVVSQCYVEVPLGASCRGLLDSDAAVRMHTFQFQFQFQVPVRLKCPLWRRAC